MAEQNLPYWLVNVPQEEWPSSCPEFLVNANEKDREILGTPDAEYHRLTWPELQHIISLCAEMPRFYVLKLIHARDKPDRPPPTSAI